MKKFFLCMMCLFALCGYAQKVCTGVCGVKFGDSYYNVGSILRNKFGMPDDHNKNEIVYYNKEYAGFHFDRIMFRFQYDTQGNSYLNKCIMGADSKTSSGATDMAYYFAYKLLSSYDMEKGVKVNGFDSYTGGVDPTNRSNNGVAVGIVIYDDGYYGVGIHYGPYNYVDEDF